MPLHLLWGSTMKTVFPVFTIFVFGVWNPSSSLLLAHGFVQIPRFRSDPWCHWRFFQICFHPVFELFICMHCEAVSSQICCCRPAAAPVSSRTIYKHQHICSSEVLHADVFTLHPPRSDTWHGLISSFSKEKVSSVQRLQNFSRVSIYSLVLPVL